MCRGHYEHFFVEGERWRRPTARRFVVFVVLWELWGIYTVIGEVIWWNLASLLFIFFSSF